MCKLAGILYAALAVLVPNAALAGIEIVPAFPCVEFFGGNWTVPPDSEIVVAQRWEAKTKGLVRQFLNAQTSLLAIDGAEPDDVSDTWGPVLAVPGGYRSSSLMPTGITLAAGQSITFDLSLAMSHRVHDGFTLADGDSSKPLFFGPGIAFEWSCTVSATD